MVERTNPFVYGRVVTGDEFFGRKILVKQLRGHIQSGQNVVLFGERRMGKTSLVYEVLSKHKERNILRFDFNEVKTIEEIVARAVEGIRRMESRIPLKERLMRLVFRVGGTIDSGTDPVTGLPSFSITPHISDPVTSIAGLFDFIEESHKQQPLAVFFDEFQGLLELKDSRSLLGAIRGRIQYHAEIPYLFAGSVRRRMYEIFMDPQNPFYKSALPIEVGPLPFEEFAEFLRKAFSTGKRRIDNQFSRTINELIYENTGDIQHLCSALWEVSQPGDVIDQQHLNRSLELVWQTEEPFYAARRRKLSVVQDRVLRALAETGGKEPFGAVFRKKAGNVGPSSIQRALDRLEKDEFIFQPFDSAAGCERYRFYQPFFRLWLIRQNVIPIPPTVE